MRRGLRTAVGAVVLAACAATASAQALRWTQAGRPTPQAVQALALLAEAPRHGLDVRDYGVDALRAAFDAVPGAPLDAAAAGRLEQALDEALRRYLRDLHDGRVDPRTLQHDFEVAARPPFDADAVLAAARAGQDLAQAVREAAPALPQYARLREALARYRALDASAWREPLPPLPRPRGERAGRLDPGQPWAGLPALAARLEVLGDLAAAPAVPPTHFDAVLVAALRAFQRRHGLDDDGVLGRATLGALEVPPSRRVRQLELALERLRWTPWQQGPRMIVINVPEFMLRAYEVEAGGRVVVRAAMAVIVGQALDTRTPLIDEPLRRIEFRPFWNVPRSIALKELLPRLRRDPGYWVREGFEFVDGQGRADPVLSQARLQAVQDGVLRIRQRPGPRNALGDVKFVFPNREAIYLHHTPAVGLFGRARRDFSHGCIRVEQPVALARFALEGLPGWDEARIRAAMADGTAPAAPLTVTLAAPIPVLVAYTTALVKEGRVHFFDDLYGHDRALDAALRQRPLGAPLAP